MKVIHKISNIDVEALTGICSICGPVAIKLKQGRYWKCRNLLRTHSRNKKYTKKYGVRYEDLDPATNCEVCGGTLRIAYDHNHQTGAFRGWLCMRCNTALGLVNEDPDILNGLIKYLEQK